MSNELPVPQEAEENAEFNAQFRADHPDLFILEELKTATVEHLQMVLAMVERRLEGMKIHFQHAMLSAWENPAQSMRADEEKILLIRQELQRRNTEKK